jgi:hypothetical protein
MKEKNMEITREEIEMIKAIWIIAEKYLVILSGNSDCSLAMKQEKRPLYSQLREKFDNLEPKK